MFVEEKDKIMQIKMELSNNQVLAIKKALDLYSRVLCGQIEETVRVIKCTDFSKDYTKEQQDKAALGADLIKQALFSEVYPATYGITNERKLARKAAIAYDIYQVIEKFTEDFVSKKTYIGLNILKTGKENIPTIELC